MCSVGVSYSIEYSVVYTDRPNALKRLVRAASIEVATGYFSYGAFATFSASRAAGHEVPGSIISSVLGTYVLVSSYTGTYIASLVLPLLFSGGASVYLVIVDMNFVVSRFNYLSHICLFLHYTR